MKFGYVVAGALAVVLAGCDTASNPDAGNLEPPELPAGAEVEEPEDIVMPSDAEQEAAAAEAQRQAEEGVIYVGEDKKGGEISLSVGQTLRIELESVPTAGMSWQIVEKPDFLEQAGDNTRPTNPALQTLPGFVGGNHYQSFDLKAVSEGTGVIKMTEGRPWETEVEPTDTFELTVTVTAAE